MDRTILVEICCGSADDVIEADRAGANRAELNSDLFHGGLTPSIGSLLAAKEQAHQIQIMAMVRPRQGGFCYTEAEFRTMLLDARELLRAGADGIVFGFLNQDGSINLERCRAMLEVIGEKPSVFHRAFDVTPDWREALEQLISLRVTRILTSGQEPSAPLGVETLKEMVQLAAGRIEILPGAGLNHKTAPALVAATGCSQIHLSGKRRVCFDTSTAGNDRISFGGALYPPEDRYQIVDGEYVQGICECMGRGAGFRGE